MRWRSNHEVPKSRLRPRLAKIAETGEVVEGNSRGSTATLLFKRLAELGIEPANREAYFANAICDALPDDRACRECRYLDDSAPDILRQPRSLGLQDIMRFLKSMASWVASGGGFVSQEEAERRLIMMTLEHTRDNKTRAAEILGISLKTLHNKLNKLRLRPRKDA